MLSRYDDDVVLEKIVVKGNAKKTIFQVKIKPMDVVVLVPGTMDPVNIMDNQETDRKTKKPPRRKPPPCRTKTILKKMKHYKKKFRIM